MLDCPAPSKLLRHDRTGDPTFAQACSRTFYVSQPMRIGTRDALPTLGFVEAGSRRFNSYVVTDLGRALLEAACPAARRALPRWVSGGDPPMSRRAIVGELDPTRSLPDGAREILRGAFVSGSAFDGARRRHALAIVEGLRSSSGRQVTWERRPPEIVDDGHWADMRAGAALTVVTEAAAGEVEDGSVLARIEALMGATGTRRLAVSDAVDDGMHLALDRLRARSDAFLLADHDPSPGRAATRFCEDCADSDPLRVIGRLLARDGQILRVVDGDILPGPAFRGWPTRGWEGDAPDPADDEASERAPAEVAPALPEGMSVRVHNLAALAPDLRPAPVSTLGL